MMEQAVKEAYQDDIEACDIILQSNFDDFKQNPKPENTRDDRSASRDNMPSNSPPSNSIQNKNRNSSSFGQDTEFNVKNQVQMFSSALQNSQIIDLQPTQQEKLETDDAVVVETEISNNMNLRASLNDSSHQIVIRRPSKRGQPKQTSFDTFIANR